MKGYKEQSYLLDIRDNIVKQYKSHPTGCGGSFGELLCYEIHTNNLTFITLAKKWGISLPTLGELIKDHCDRLQKLPKIDFTINPIKKHGNKKRYNYKSKS